MEKSQISNFKFDLEERLIDFAVRVSAVSESLPKSFFAKHLSGQLARSGTSPALNYGEAQAAESRTDFIHKMRICLKELRETQINLRIIQRKGYFPDERLNLLLSENGELVAIFMKSIHTAVENKGSTGKKE